MYFTLSILLLSSYECSSAKTTKLNVHEKYYGSWRTNNDFLDYTQNSGYIKIKFPKQSSCDKSIIVFSVKNGIYSNDNKKKFGIHEVFYDKEQNIYFNTTNVTHISSSLKGKHINGYILIGEETDLKGKFCVEMECIDFSATGQCLKYYEKSRVIYCFVLFCICFLQCFIVSRMHDLVRSDENVARNTSLMSWVMNGSIDFSVTAFNMQELIRNQESMESMMMGLIWSVVSFYAIRAKLLFDIFYAQRPSLTISSAYMLFTRKILIFCIFYLDIVCSFTNLLAYQIKSLYYVQILFMFSFFIPQIYLSAKYNMVSPFSPFIYIIITASRIILLVIFI